MLFLSWRFTALVLEDSGYSLGETADVRMHDVLRETRNCAEESREFGNFIAGFGERFGAVTQGISQTREFEGCLWSRVGGWGWGWCNCRLRILCQWDFYEVDWVRRQTSYSLSMGSLGSQLFTGSVRPRSFAASCSNKRAVPQ